MKFQYAPLNTKNGDIRLLDLQPGKEQDNIRMTPRHVQLKAPPEVPRKRKSLS